MNKKLILSSIFSIVLCICLISGATFALFTSEYKNNIAINSGDVDVVARMENLKLYSPTEIDLDGNIVNDDNAAGANSFVNGGTATLEGATLSISGMAAGDSVEFDIIIENKSTIAAKYYTSFFIAKDNGLYGELEITTANGEALQNDWANINPGEGNKTIPVKVALPEDSTAEKLSTELIFSVTAVQGNVDTSAMIINDAQLAAAIARGDETVRLATGNFNMPSNIQNKTVTITKYDADSTPVINMLSTVNGTGSDIIFDGVTINTLAKHDGDLNGITHVNTVTFKNCTLNGSLTMYGNEATFTKCNFINYADYNVWTYGVDTSFEDCTFTTGGKAILVYQHGPATAEVTVSGCTFNSDGSLATDKAAIEVGDDPGAKSEYTIKISNSTANGFATNNSTDPLWGNKNNMPPERLNVTLDGNRVLSIVDDESLSQMFQIFDEINLDGNFNETLNVPADKKLVIDGADISVGAGNGNWENVLDVHGDLSVNGGNFYGYQLATSTGSSIVINEGTFDFSWGIRVGGDCDIVISGGSFDSPFLVCRDSGILTVTISGGDFNIETFSGGTVSGTEWLTITGGTFNIDPTDYVDTENYKVENVGGIYTVTAK